jgi:WD40 repeat protein
MAAVGSLGTLYYGIESPTGRGRPKLESIQMGGLEAVGVCFSGSNIYFAHRDGAIYECRPGTQPIRIYSHPLQSNYLASSQQGMIASVDNDGEIRLWSTLDRCLSVLRSPQPKRLSCVAWGKQGILAAGRSDGKLITLLPNSKQPLLSKDTCGEHIRCVSFSPSGTLLATGSSDWKITLWSPEGRILRQLDGHRSDIYTVVFSPSGDVLASADRQGQVLIWDTQTWNPLAEFKAADRPLFALAFSPDGKRLWIGGQSAFLALDFCAIDEVIRENSRLSPP